MKYFKKVLMLACASVTVFSNSLYAADPKVSFYGLIDVYTGSVKSEGDDKRSVVTNSSGMTTSFIGVKTTIDMGGGLTGLATLESFLRPDIGERGRFSDDDFSDGSDDGDTFFARSAYIGLKGDFGKVTMGRNTTPYFISVIKTNPFGGSFGFGPSIKHSFLGGLNGDSGWSNSISYAAPSMNNIDVSVLYSAGEIAGENGANKIGVSAFYSEGKLSGTVGYQSVDASADDSAAPIDDTQSATMAGVGYDLGVAKLFGQYLIMEDNKAAGDMDFDTIQIGATIPVEGAKVLVSYATTTKTVVASGAETDRKTYAVGYDKNFTKKVDLYVVLYRDDFNDTDGAASTVAFGGRFRF